MYQDKIWYKTDRLGHEGEAERLATLLLLSSSLSPSEYVHYERICINGVEGCCSENFLKTGESFSGSFALNYDYLKEYADLKIDVAQFQNAISKEPKSRRAELLLHRLSIF
jgi:hypothetical protein